MNKECLYVNKNILEYPLDENIDVLQELNDSEYIVSNIEKSNTQVHAPEIDFYIKNTQDEISQKIINIKKLYDARLLAYDLAQDRDYEQHVGSKLLVVASKEKEELKQELKSLGFTCKVLSFDEILDISGHIGELVVSIKKNGEMVELQTDQIIWFNAPTFALKQSGTYDPVVIGLADAIKSVKKNSGKYRYKNFIKYDSDICQYHERSSEICGKCAEVCPTVAIVKIDKKKHLNFSHIDCHGCGGCISVCPSGALDYSLMPRVSFEEVTKLYANKVALIIPRKMELESLCIDLPVGVLPFAIEGEKFLHEAHLIALVQMSQNPIIFYTDFISKGSGDAIEIINEIFKRKYNKQAIFICKNKTELVEAFSNINSVKESKYSISIDNLSKREIFSARLAHLVGKDDLGVVKTADHIHYANMVINQDTCTLCLSCVGACNVKALTAHPQDNTLRFNLHLYVRHVHIVRLSALKKTV